MRKIIAAALLATVAAFAAACTNATDANRNGASTTTNTATTNTNATTNASPQNQNAATGASSSDVPPAARAALSDATSITADHKTLSASQIATIERDTNTKLKDTDHHAYLGFATTGGARRQTGAATVVEAAGKQMVVVYESKNGTPAIKEVRAEGVPQAFLDQFKGKGHDNKFQLGDDLKANGADDATARAAADAIRQDAMIMQTLYGGAHGH